MSHPFLNVPATLSTDAIKQDVTDLLKHNKAAQRYSTTRDSFVTLYREFGDFVMEDGRTGIQMRQLARYDKADRLVADWTSFTSQYAANL